MKKQILSALATATLLAALAPAAMAQNVAIVNGKAVPKARVEALMSQALRQGNQQRTPELEQQVRDEVVLRRTDERAGTVHVHFPRIGYVLRAVA